MKILSLLLIPVIIFSIIGTSYGQLSVPKPGQILPDVLVQIYLRDDKSNLVGYVEATRIVSIDPVSLNKFLDTQEKKIIHKNGKGYELFQFEWNTETFSTYHSMAIYALIPNIDGNFVDVLEVKHDAYQIKPGDSIKVYYTILRPVP